ncbi:MAG TPA: hypothetical protein VJS64_09465 [Pyrinomonadaceae bacterium]|nr:hypothetical protein [Pyrinomonadaceae bacterium]
MTEPIRLHDANGSTLTIYRSGGLVEVRIDTQDGGNCFHATPEQWQQVAGDPIHARQRGCSYCGLVVTFNSVTDCQSPDGIKRMADHVLECEKRPEAALFKQIEQLQARIKQLEQDVEFETSLRESVTQGEWLDVESAPRDGTKVLIAYPEYGVGPALKVASAEYTEMQGGGWKGCSTDRDWYFAPLYWQPLPRATKCRTGGEMKDSSERDLAVANKLALMADARIAELQARVVQLEALLGRVEHWFSERNVLGGEAPFLVADIRAALAGEGAGEGKEN